MIKSVQLHEAGSLFMTGIFNGNLSSYVHRARIPGIFSYYIVKAINFSLNELND